jgi:hypothetical protein
MGPPPRHWHGNNWRGHRGRQCVYWSSVAGVDVEAGVPARVAGRPEAQKAPRQGGPTGAAWRAWAGRDSARRGGTEVERGVTEGQFAELGS